MSEANQALFTLVQNLQAQLDQLKTNQIKHEQKLQSNDSFKQIIVAQGKNRGDPVFTNFPETIPTQAREWVEKNPAVEKLTSKERKDIIRQYMEVKSLRHLKDENGMVQQLVKDKTKSAFITRDLANAAKDNLAISRMAVSMLTLIEADRQGEIDPKKVFADILKVSLNNVHRIAKSQQKMALEASGLQQAGKLAKVSEYSTDDSIIWKEHIESATQCNELLRSFYKTRPRPSFSPSRRGGRGRGKRGRHWRGRSNRSWSPSHRGRGGHFNNNNLNQRNSFNDTKNGGT